MKQIIDKYTNGKIRCKYYENNSGQKHGLVIVFFYNGNIGIIQNYNNGKRFGLWCGWWVDKSLKEQKYYL